MAVDRPAAENERDRDRGGDEVVVEGQLTASDELERIVESFRPSESGVVHAAGYGSGVFVQQHQKTLDLPESSSSDGGGRGGDDNSPVVGKDAESAESEEEEEEDLPMIDLLLSVEDAVRFHEFNLAVHPDHYSSLCRAWGPGGTASIQRSDWGARVFFNPLVDSPVDAAANETFHLEGNPGRKKRRRRRRKIKYGAIQTDDLLLDLTRWEWLYVAGRMHKPTASVRGYTDDRVAEAQDTNLRMALGASLLLLEHDGSERADGDSDEHGASKARSCYDIGEVYEKIAGLSYGGDPRMDAGAEDPHKVSKLVSSPGQQGRFWELYRPHLEGLSRRGLIDVRYNNDGSVAGTGSTVVWDPRDASARRELFSGLPPKVRRAAVFADADGGGGSGSEGAAVTPPRLAAALAGIVRPAARYQSLKGLLTAGVARSAKYAAAKFAKGAFRGFVGRR